MTAPISCQLLILLAAALTIIIAGTITKVWLRPHRAALPTIIGLSRAGMRSRHRPTIDRHR